MMVPRSYSLLRQARSPDHQRQPHNEKMGVRTNAKRQNTIPTSMPRLIKSVSDKKDAARTLASPPSPARSDHAQPAPVTSTEPPHSKPVVIPPRTPTKTVNTTQTVRERGQKGGRASSQTRVPANHKADAIPPAVAALLAVTEIPRLPNTTRRRKGSSRDRRISMDELIQEWKREDEGELSGSSVVGSPMDLLLGRVDESEEDYGSLGSMDQEKDSLKSARPCLSTRSISSDSLLSTVPPSLDPDAPSFTSTWDDLSTPASFSRRSSDRREKTVQSPPKEDCILDHPLLHFNPDAEEDAEMVIADIVSSEPVSTARFKSFKSNLTASLQALKSAAKSFSNFTAPSVPPDDLLTRSLLSPKFTSEMRPRHLEGLPSPALRRYLNPQPAPISPTELSMHLHDSLTLDFDKSETAAPMIQMQTYDRRNPRATSRKRNRSASDPFSEAGRALRDAPAVRQREPRENADFLRVIVLEMNMRRVGKLDAKAVGKARIWLPPRQAGVGKTDSHGGVPDRWVGVLAQEEN